MVLLLAVGILTCVFFFPDLNMTTLVQQSVTGMSTFSLICVPMFIFAAEIITAGESANRIRDMVKAFLGHVPGGLPVSVAASCTLFGAVSGSTQATVAAIGPPFRPMLLEAGYNSPFTLGLIINSSDIAKLIPPSIGFIIFGVITGTSIGQLFLAGIVPGILIFLTFSVYCVIYSKWKRIALLPKASWGERLNAVKASGCVFGFPVIIIGGIYMGVFSPVEASAMSVLYALLVETVLYRTIGVRQLQDAAKSTALLTSVVFILIGAGQAISWLLSYAYIPQTLAPTLFGTDPSLLRVVLVVIIAFFVAGFFVDNIVALFILLPAFMPHVVQAGIDPVWLGVLVTLQGAIASATPPFGVDIFTAMVIFRRPYLEVIAHTWPFVLILLLCTVILIAFPGMSTFLPRLAFG